VPFQHVVSQHPEAQHQGVALEQTARHPLQVQISLDHAAVKLKHLLTRQVQAGPPALGFEVAPAFYAGLK